MSLAINTDLVKAVLLADGWHEVADNSFDLDSYEYLSGPGDGAPVVHGGGQSGVCATGFTFDQGADSASAVRSLPCSLSVTDVVDNTDALRHELRTALDELAVTHRAAIEHDREALETFNEIQARNARSRWATRPSES